MLFIDWPFPLFLLVVFVVHWSLRSASARKTWLLLASYYFYGSWDWRFLGLVWLSTAVDFIAARRIERSVDPRHARRWLLLSLATNLGLLAFFKYFGFFAESLVALAQRSGLALSQPTLEVVLPVGISFYTFQTLSYTLDVYRGRLTPVTNLRDFALFVAFFPQLVAGPIVRAADFLPQLERPRRLTDVAWRWAWWMLLTGYIKKACLADHIGTAIDPIFAAPEAYTGAALALAAVLYGAQIFCDFSGYSDMAIGMALLLGYQLPLNFRGPYVARNVADFWHRWHISLSTWLRDYLYIPLGGNRCSRLRQHANLMITMLLGGLWHGAGWRFIWWGGLHGAALVLHQGWSQREKRLPLPVAWLLTSLWVTVCWVLFRAHDLDTAQLMLKRIVVQAGDGGQLASSWAGLLAIAWCVHWVAAHVDVRRLVDGCPGWLSAPLFGALWAAALAFAHTSQRPFIYFQF